jgi:hypothetical protein
MGQVQGSVRRLDQAHLDLLENYGILSPQFLATMALPKTTTTTSLQSAGGFGADRGGLARWGLRGYGAQPQAVNQAVTTTGLAAYSPGWQSLREYLLYAFGQVSDKKWLRYEIDVTAELCSPTPVFKQLSITVVGTQRVPWQVMSRTEPGNVVIAQGGLVGTPPDTLLAWPGQGDTSLTQMGEVMKIVYDFFNEVNRSLLVGPSHPIIVRIYEPKGEEWGDKPGIWRPWVETRAERELNTFLDALEAASSETGIVLRMDRNAILQLSALNDKFLRTVPESIQSCRGAGRDADVDELNRKYVKLQSLQSTLQRLLQTGGGGTISGTLSA